MSCAPYMSFSTASILTCLPLSSQTLQHKVELRCICNFQCPALFIMHVLVPSSMNITFVIVIVQCVPLTHFFNFISSFFQGYNGVLYAWGTSLVTGSKYSYSYFMHMFGSICLVHCSHLVTFASLSQFSKL